MSNAFYVEQKGLELDDVYCTYHKTWPAVTYMMVEGIPYEVLPICETCRRVFLRHQTMLWSCKYCRVRIASDTDFTPLSTPHSVDCPRHDEWPSERVEYAGPWGEDVKDGVPLPPEKHWKFY